jgi:hypothetical protein
MRFETWTLAVKVTVDLDAIGGWTPQDVVENIESGVSQMEGVANVECLIGESRVPSYSIDSDNDAAANGERIVEAVTEN